MSIIKPKYMDNIPEELRIPHTEWLAQLHVRLPDDDEDMRKALSNFDACVNPLLLRTNTIAKNAIDNIARIHSQSNAKGVLYLDPTSPTPRFTMYVEQIDKTRGTIGRELKMTSRVGQENVECQVSHETIYNKREGKYVENFSILSKNGVSYTYSILDKIRFLQYDNGETISSKISVEEKKHIINNIEMFSDIAKSISTPSVTKLKTLLGIDRYYIVENTEHMM